MTNTQVKGMHHVTAITSSAEKNYQWFTEVLGMRLVKKTVNQDDIQTYHLFFADDKGNPGTDMTFFDFPNVPKGSKGTDDIARTSLRVPSNHALDYWLKRFEKYDVKHSEIIDQFGVKVIQFEDFDTQQYQLVSDEGQDGLASGTAWKNGPVPEEFGITGLGPVLVRVSNFKLMKEALESVLGYKEIAKEQSLHLFEIGEGGNGARILIEENVILPRATQGYGSVHHAAFRLEDRAALDFWIDKMKQLGVPNSGYVDRFYFESLYTRLYPAVLFEFATDEPGFINPEEDGETYETLGETLALPPKYKSNRDQIEQLVRQFDTTRSTKTFEKEYLGFEGN